MIFTQNDKRQEAQIYKNKLNTSFDGKKIAI